MSVEILNQLQAEFKTWTAKQADEVKTLGSAHAETTKALVELAAKISELDKRITESQVKATEDKSIADFMKESDSIQRVLRRESSKGSFVIKGAQAASFLERKTTFTASGSAGFATSGVYQIDRTPGIVLEARRRPRVLEMIPSRPTSLAYVDFVKVNAALAMASPQGGEGLAKFENTTTLNTTSRKVETIATWIKVSKQALDDMSELQGYISNGLMYNVAKKLDEQILSGSGAANYLSGLTTEAQSFDTSLLPSATLGYTYIDTIGTAIMQAAGDDEIDPSFVVLNPLDAWRVRMTKDNDKRYILGDPNSQVPPNIWDLTIVPTNAMTVGSFLVGSSSPVAAEYRPRLEINVEVSTEDSDNFEKNLVTVRAECRGALAIYRPAAFVYGSLAKSPA